MNDQDTSWLDELEVEFLHGVPVKLPEKAKTAIQSHWNTEVERIIGRDEDTATEHDELRNLKNKIRNDLRAEQRLLRASNNPKEGDKS